MKQVDTAIRHQLNSDIALINTLAEYIIQSGGKRLRPMLVLLAAKSVGYSGEQDINIAAVIEFIHTATLLHDDVVDASDLRRGNPTANEVWGNEASVLVGDFLYSRAFEMMVSTNSMEVMNIMAATTNAIAEGEVMQLLNVHNADTTAEMYLETIYRKTARLFEAAAELGCVLANEQHEHRKSFAQYGMYLGTAFQLIDDCLDYTSDAATMGKNIGDDLAEGKPTLPLIHAMRHANSTDSQLIKDAIETGSRDQIIAITAIIQKTESLQYTATKAKEQAALAIQALNNVDDSVFKSSLIQIAHFSATREF